MVDQWNCPPLTELMRLCQGKLSPEDFESICQHLELCEKCQKFLSNLDDETDPFSLSFRSLRFVDLDLAHSIMESESQTNLVAVREFLAKQSLNTSHAASLNPPCQLGPYEILRFIGRGGMGEVYEARQIRLNRPVAIKVIRAGRQEDPVSRVSFLKEMRTVGELQHPNLVTAYDAWESEGCLYLAMELLDGESLQTVVGRGQRISPSEALKVIIGVCEGLGHLHAHQIVHRDVKPANIMRLRNGSIKLVDFGLATTSVSGLSVDQSRAGTERYMSPEQAAGTARVDHRTDIYSAGCVLRFLLQGLSESTLAPQESQIVNRLHAVAERMTRADPDARYASIVEVTQELETLQKLPDASVKRWRVMLPLSLALFLLVCGAWLLPRGERRQEAASLPLEPQAATRQDVQVAVDYPTADSFVNHVGIQFQKIPAPPTGMNWPPAPQAPELTRGVDWRNIDRDQYLSVHEVTVGQFAEVMKSHGPLLKADPEKNQLPHTNISFEEVLTFCEQLTRDDPRGLKYHLPGESLLTYAAYGKELNDGQLSARQEMLAQDIYTRPLLAVEQGDLAASGIKGICTNAWEWTASQYRKPLSGPGIIDYSTFGENSGEKWHVLQGGQFMIPFIHHCDVHFGMNDYYHSSTNLRLHTEPDQVTQYLCPIRIGERAALRFRYSFQTPVRNAEVLSCFHLFSPNSSCEIRVLADPQGESLDAADWITVFSANAKGPHNGRVDLTSVVAGAQELLVEYSLRTDVEPNHYTQLARTAHAHQVPSVMLFHAELAFPSPQLRKTVAAPRLFRHQNLGFRVCIEPVIPDENATSSVQTTLDKR